WEGGGSMSEKSADVPDGSGPAGGDGRVKRSGAARSTPLPQGHPLRPAPLGDAEWRKLWDRMYRAHEPAIRKLVFTSGTDKPEDIFQDTFVDGGIYVRVHDVPAAH